MFRSSGTLNVYQYLQEKIITYNDAYPMHRENLTHYFVENDFKKITLQIIKLVRL
jgi:hypothetical protein